MVEKKQIQREQLSHNIMRDVILRIDYLGVISIDDIVKAFTSNFKGTFKNYTKTFSNTIDLGNVDIEQISETLSVPVKELKRQEIHRFSENTFGTDDVVFDMCNYYTVLHVKCRDYKNIDPYLNFFVDYVSFLNGINEFTSIKRFGLRKIGALVKPDFESLLDNFEPDYFHTKVSNPNFKVAGNQFVDILVSEDLFYNFTYRRSIDSGFISNDGKIVPAKQALLDIDGYINENKLSETKFGIDEDETRASIRRLNDVYMFELFKLSMSNNFLNSQIHE